MFYDNSVALLIANEPGVQMGARHYHRRYLLKVHTEDNLAYPFTKALPKGKLTQHARSMGLQGYAYPDICVVIGAAGYAYPGLPCCLSSSSSSVRCLENVGSNSSTDMYHQAFLPFRETIAAKHKDSNAHSLHDVTHSPSYSSGPSTAPSYSSRPSTPTNYSLESSKNVECSNCNHLREKISVLKATMDMHMHPEQHTVNSAALFHEVLNEMEKLDLE
ncbi:hypothetical protein Tco_0194750 [Tanacetum coccineum]